MKTLRTERVPDRTLTTAAAIVADPEALEVAYEAIEAAVTGVA
jgi:hypothetical protein